MVEALLTLRGERQAGIGRDRIRLLEAVGREGSISAGARAAGITYKAAWEALDAMAQLFGRPVIETRIGGRTGGGARLTPAGEILIARFGRLESELARATRRLGEAVLAAPDVPFADAPVLRTSARNAFQGQVETVRPAWLTADVGVALPEGTRILARVTGESLQALHLTEGQRVTALIKASFVDLAPAADRGDPAGMNRFQATVRRCAVAGDDAEALLDIGCGRVLAATSTAARLRDLALAPGKPVLARFAAAQVILAVAGEIA